ncbi:hypothetical protein GCM10009682_24350 [Luedemannella flava]|uniref:Aminoglycoside phosphotransferase domain-containing protein n=1 Tax=Luedemannella flava TaxID=349316 RepID=A0ABP4YA76_9ACTN
MGADRQPFGLCHGELHPTSLHRGPAGLRLLDFGKAFHGPGLLDLATWFGTRHRPDHDRVAHLLGLYVAAGGHPDALASRGGLPAATWALGWHRVWAAAWFIEQAATGAFDATTDTAHGVIVHRQLTSAAALLRC